MSRGYYRFIEIKTKDGWKLFKLNVNGKENFIFNVDNLAFRDYAGGFYGVDNFQIGIPLDISVDTKQVIDDFEKEEGLGGHFRWFCFTFKDLWDKIESIEKDIEKEESKLYELVGISRIALLIKAIGGNKCITNIFNSENIENESIDEKIRDIEEIITDKRGDVQGMLNEMRIIETLTFLDEDFSFISDNNIRIIGTIF